MRRRSTLHTTTRETSLPSTASAAWLVVASGARGRQWYVDAAPFVVRGAIDRLAGGRGRRWPPPGTPMLSTGGAVGFWEVTSADHDARRLLLTARVRAPGTVVLTTEVEPDDGGCRLRQSVSLRPSGALGYAYLLADLGAREVVLELAHRRLVADIQGSDGRDPRASEPFAV